MIGTPIVCGGFVLLFLSIGADVNSFGFVWDAELFQGNGGLDAVRRGPGVQSDVRHGRGCDG